MGPLRGIRILELAGIGPAPFCSMLLAEMGAEVFRIERPDIQTGPWDEYDVLNRGRRTVVLDLKEADNVASLIKLIERADGLVEGFRPGVMERLNLSPDTCFSHNPGLVFGRMTGWGQEGPLANSAGHDINYIALSGVLHAIGEESGKPTIPLNLLGDFGGGAMYLAFGMVCAILEARTSGKGQVVDASMVDGSAHLMAMFSGMRHLDLWSSERGTNMLDGGAHFYNTYECSDGRWVAIGAIEPKFYEILLERLGLELSEFSPQMDQDRWPEWKSRFARLFLTRSRSQWCELLEGTDACFAPVLDQNEAAEHPHNRARENFMEMDGILQPAPAPRFSRTRARVDISPNESPLSIEQALSQWGGF